MVKKVKEKIKLVIFFIILSLLCTEYRLEADDADIIIPKEFLQMALKFSNQQISEDNIINALLFVELEVSSREMIKNTYVLLGEIVEQVKRVDFESTAPLERFTFIYRILNDIYALQYREKAGSLLSQSLPGGYYDCDTGSMVILAIAHELNWPVYAVSAKDHIFLRWHENDTKLNFDINGGVEISDELYIRYHKVHPETILKNIFLKELSRRELVGTFYYMRGNFKAGRGDYRASIRDFSIALRFNSKNPEVYVNRGVSKMRLEDYQGAIVDYTKGIELDPNDEKAYFNRALATLIDVALRDEELGEEDFTNIYNPILMDFRKAVKLEPEAFDRIPDKWKELVKQKDFYFEEIREKRSKREL